MAVPALRALSFAEDLSLLLLDESSGLLYPLPGRTLDFGLATASLLELTEGDRIDTDLDSLYLVNASPLGDPAADAALEQIAASEETRSPEYWVRRIGVQLGAQIGDAALGRLVERGILEPAPGNHYFLTAPVAHARRYPAADGESTDEVRVRLMKVLFSNEIPEPRDADLIGLAEACGVFTRILSRAERERVGDRIELVKSLNLLCRTAAQVIGQDLRERPPARRTYRQIPAARGLPLIGVGLAMNGDLQEFVSGLYRDYGPICRISVPGRTMIVMGGREANAFVQKHARTHLRSNRSFTDFCHAMETDRAMISMDGHDHMQLRRTAQAGYSRSVIEGSMGTAVEIVRRAVASWPVGRPLPAFRSMQQIVAEHLGVLATGHSPAGYVEDLKYWFDSLIFAVRRDRPKFLRERRLRKVRPRIKELYGQVMELHAPELREGCPGDLIDAFLELHHREPQFLPETDLMSAVIGPYIAALDTVAGTLGFALLRLLQDPEYEQSLRDEADAAFAGGTPDGRRIRGLAKTHAFVKEVMRCHTITPVLMRTACNSFEFEGCFVPAGATLLLATGVVHGDPGYFPSPERFDPDRHLPPRLESKRQGAFVPFGIGPHTCIGGPFAEVQLAATLATMLHYAEFDRAPPDDRGIRVTAYPTIRPHKRCRFQVVRLRHDGGAAP